LLVVALLCVGVASGAVESRQRDIDEQVVSVALAGRVHALVVLPAGYATSRTRYPVVYFLHGLPATSLTYRANRWLAQALAQAGSAILVEPQGARATDRDPEYLDWGRGRNWATYVTTELPEYVDAHFRTIRSRRGRALVGLSAGGYGAAMLGLNHLGRFAAIESWSGYFHPTDPTGTKAVMGGPGANVHRLISTLWQDERRRSTFLAFYVGGGDSRFRKENEQFERELASAHVPHVFAVYQGAHETSLWKRHARSWLALALAHLDRPGAT
jgi:enterochelin esterase-like enzyme